MIPLGVLGSSKRMTDGLALGFLGALGGLTSVSGTQYDATLDISSVPVGGSVIVAALWKQSGSSGADVNVYLGGAKMTRDVTAQSGEMGVTIARLARPVGSSTTVSVRSNVTLRADTQAVAAWYVDGAVDVAGTDSMGGGNGTTSLTATSGAGGVAIAAIKTGQDWPGSVSWTTLGSDFSGLLSGVVSGCGSGLTTGGTISTTATYGSYGDDVAAMVAYIKELA